MSTLPAAISQPAIGAARPHTALIAIAASTATAIVVLSLTSIHPRHPANHVSAEGRSLSPVSLTAAENSGPRGKKRAGDAKPTATAVAATTDTATAGSNRNRGTSLRRQR
ncbi:hypothetical protein [Cyanobium sp. CH-040]|uniref:hypothetical protein n=1 Tax=Cyanobium sp. CH-040 TaxID=2823708 RepID=UPI0020CC9026|nr:hypothetical protein [Cyanobium sp. CH-040]MCP9928259.1 hypothetical protein [Cyanobium sp. CH-040]